jgi:hypothetical protein
VGVQRADDPLELDGRARWIEAPLIRRDLSRVGRTRVVLLVELQAPGLAQVEGAQADLAGELREPRREPAEVLALADRDRFLERHRA